MWFWALLILFAENLCTDWTGFPRYLLGLRSQNIPRITNPSREVCIYIFPCIFKAANSKIREYQILVTNWCPWIVKTENSKPVDNEAACILSKWDCVVMTTSQELVRLCKFSPIFCSLQMMLPIKALHYKLFFLQALMKWLWKLTIKTKR